MDKKLIFAGVAICALVWLLIRSKQTPQKRPRRGPVFRLRSKREQRDPIQAVYNPKQYRRPRK